MRRPDPQPEPDTPAPAGEFVQRTGSVLTFAGRPFRFLGNNVYFNQADIVYGRAAALAETFDKMAALGMTVARCNAHNDNDPSRDPAAIQLSPGVFSESSLAALDLSIAMAAERGLRLILKLTNNWDAFGGIRRYVAWRLGRAPAPAEWGLFYTDPVICGWYRGYVQMLAERRNTVTGLAYRDEPAILAWELGNELRNPAPGGADALVAWTAEMAAFAKQHAPRHLVADGGEGFDDAPALYPGLRGRYSVSGADGASYHRLALIPELDMLSYHLYPASWGMSDGVDAEIFIRRHEEIARAAGKVAYLGEFGWRSGNRHPGGAAFDAQRADVFASWIRAAAVEASAGVMAWQLIDDAREDAEGFQIHSPADSVSCDVFRRASASIAASPMLVNAASFRGICLAPGSIATLFGPNLAGAEFEIADADGDRHRPAVLFHSDTQANLLIPDEVPVGAAVLRVIRAGAVETAVPFWAVPAAPGLFHVSTGDGEPGGAQTGLPVAHPAPSPASVTPGGQRALSLYGTGIRGAPAITATAGGVPAEILYSGPQGRFPGLDQVNLLLPSSLAGAGEIEIELIAGGVPSNRVRALLS